MNEASAIVASIPRGEHTVLVVDDHPATRYATARTLRAAGFKTVEASGGQQALDLAPRDVSAVVLDVHMPDLDGFEVCRRLRSDVRTEFLPIIHLSAARVEGEDRIAGLNAGADAYLVHPADPAILVATVQALIRARNAEDRYKRSEEKFYAIYRLAESGIALIDADGRFQDANPAMLSILGRRADEVLGRRICEFAEPASADWVRDKTAVSEATKDLWHAEFPLVDARHNVVHLEWSVSAHVHRDFRVAVVSNASDRIAFEKQRSLLLEREQAARAAAERLSRTKDDFIAVLSHELRNPLSSILMNVHVLGRMDLPGKVSKSIAAIGRNANTQARIISDILDVSRINSGKLSLQREQADAAALVSASLESFGSALDAKKIDLVLDLQAPPATVWIDPARFQQIVWNLFSNALKFSDVGGRIEVTLAQEQELLTLTIRDFGKGIDPEFLTRIFEKFTQSDAPGNRAHGGLGLGMSIVKHLIELHGGRIEVRSDGPGSGTTVLVAVPQHATQSASMHALVDCDQGISEPDTDFPLRNVSILLVEDDMEAAALLANILRERGAKVMVAFDYGAATRLMAQSQPDLLVSDIGLPGKDGYEVVRELRRLEAGDGRLPAIALTAFGRPSDRDAAVEAGFDEHMAKPLEPQLLLDTITRLLSGRQAGLVG